MKNKTSAVIVALIAGVMSLHCFAQSANPLDPATSALAKSDQIQDVSEAMKLLPVQMEVMQIAFSMMGGDSSKAQATAQNALDEVNKVLSNNPQSLPGLQTRCMVKNVMQTDSGNADCAQAMVIVNERLVKYPTDANYYKMRADMYEAAGRKEDAIADLTAAQNYMANPKDKAALDKRINAIQKTISAQ